jgi:hypothetical protein
LLVEKLLIVKIQAVSPSRPMICYVAPLVTDSKIIERREQSKTTLKRSKKSLPMFPSNSSLASNPSVSLYLQG